jgi:NH3-dependent NAD+ synthetase
MPGEMRDLRLPSDLCQSAEEKYGNRFGTLEQLLTHVLEQLLRDDAKKIDQEEQRIIEERLKDLGYI